MAKLSYVIDWDALDEELDATPNNWGREEFAREVLWLSLRGEDFRVESDSNNYRV